MVASVGLKESLQVSVLAPKITHMSSDSNETEWFMCRLHEILNGVLDAK